MFITVLHNRRFTSSGCDPTFISKLDIFPLICATDKVWITELTLIHKNIRPVRNSHVQELTLKIIGQIDIKHILTSPIKTITPVLKILTYITGVHPAGAPPKIGKNMIFWHKIVIFHTKYPKQICASLCSSQFF